MSDTLHNQLKQCIFCRFYVTATACCRQVFQCLRIRHKRAKRQQQIIQCCFEGATMPVNMHICTYISVPTFIYNENCTAWRVSFACCFLFFCLFLLFVLLSIDLTHLSVAHSYLQPQPLIIIWLYSWSNGISVY